jgi:signal transduction histidine kinase
VTVRLTIASGRVHLEIADDGRGFDPDDPTSTGALHFGLQVMRGRAEGIGGTFDIQSEVGGGTRVTVTLPVRQRGDADEPGTHSPRR